MGTALQSILDRMSDDIIVADQANRLLKTTDRYACAISESDVDALIGHWQNDGSSVRRWL